MSTVAEKNVFVNPFYQEGIGRRTGIQLKKDVRKDSDGFENFDDYWSESENESILDKTTNANKENVATIANEAEGKPTPRRKKSSLKSMPAFSPSVASSDREKTHISESQDVQETSVAAGDASLKEADITGSVIKGPANTLEPSSAISKFKTKKRLSFSSQEEAGSDSGERSGTENDQGADQETVQGTKGDDDRSGSSTDSTIKPDSSQSELTEDEKTTSDSEMEQKHDGKSQKEEDTEETPKATVTRSKEPLANNTTLKAEEVPSSSQQPVSPRRTRRSVRNDTTKNKPSEKSVMEKSSEGLGGESSSSDPEKLVAEGRPRRSTRQSIKDKSLPTSAVVKQNSSSTYPEEPAPEDQRRKSSRQSVKNAVKVDKVEVRRTRRSARNAVEEDNLPNAEELRIDDQASKSNQDTCSSQETSSVDEKDVDEVQPLKSVRRSDAVTEMTREETDACDEKVDATHKAPAEDALDKDLNSEEVTKRLVSDNSEAEVVSKENGNEASSQELPEDASDPNNESDAVFLSLLTAKISPKNKIRSLMKSIELDDEEDLEIGDVDTQEWGIRNDSSSDGGKAGKGKKGRQEKGDVKNMRQGDKAVKGTHDEENKPIRRKSQKGKSMKTDEDLGEETDGDVKRKHSKKQQNVSENKGEDHSEATTKEHKGKQRRNKSVGHAGRNKRKSRMGERASNEEERRDESDEDDAENPAKMGKTRSSQRKGDDQRKKSVSETKGNKRRATEGKGSSDGGDSYGEMKTTQRHSRRKRASGTRDDHPDEMVSENSVGAPEEKRKATRSTSRSSATSDLESEGDAAKKRKGKGKQKNKKKKGKRRQVKKSTSQQSDVAMDDHAEVEIPDNGELRDVEDNISRNSKQRKEGAKRSRSLSRKSSKSNVHFGTRTRISDAGDTSVHQLLSSEGEAENAHGTRKIPLTPGVVLSKKGRKSRKTESSLSDRTSESEKDTEDPETAPSSLKKKKKGQPRKRKSQASSSQTSSTEDEPGPSGAKSRKTSEAKTGDATSMPSGGSDSRDATSAEEQAVDAVIDFLDSYDKRSEHDDNTTKHITPATTHGSQQEELSVTPVSILKTGGKRNAKFKNRKKFSFFFTEVATNKAYIIEPQSEDGLRRTKRHRVRPLEYWRNERPLYERRKSGGFALTGVLSPEMNDESKRQRPKKPAKVKGQLPQTPKNISMHVSPPVGTQPAVDTSVTVVNPESNEEVVVDAVATSKMLKYLGPGGLPAEPQDAITISKALSQKAFSAGVLTIRPLQEKGSQLVRRDTMVFYVVRGKVAVTVHQTVNILQNGDFFFVPKGNVYNIKNLRKDTAKLTFFQHKGQ